jgi:hypothetical protein
MFDEEVLSNLAIGDLVRLNEDIDLQVGYGLIVDIKYNFDDIYDLIELNLKITKIKDPLSRTDDFYPTKPQILVMWTGANNGKILWMYASELTLIQKVSN